MVRWGSRQGTLGSIREVSTRARPVILKLAYTFGIAEGALKDTKA